LIGLARFYGIFTQLGNTFRSSKPKPSATIVQRLLNQLLGITANLAHYISLPARDEFNARANKTLEIALLTLF
jgi:hypothetical protein